MVRRENESPYGSAGLQNHIMRVLADRHADDEKSFFDAVWAQVVVDSEFLDPALRYPIGQFINDLCLWSPYFYTIR